MTVARETPTNKNVELGGRDGCKLFHYGVTSFMRPKVRRINGGWWISIARQLRIFYCFTTLICDETKKRYSKALQLLFEVHHKLRYHVLKLQINEFQNTINELLAAMIDINRPHCPSACKSIKYHWGYHWAQSRLQLGCTADEKSLERMLGESQNFLKAPTLDTTLMRKWSAEPWKCGCYKICYTLQESHRCFKTETTYHYIMACLYAPCCCNRKLPQH